MGRRYLQIVACVLFLSGCATFDKHSSNFSRSVQNVKTIAVLPPDVRVYEIKAGGVQEEIDEWSQTAQKNIENSLKKHFGERYKYELKFISKDWLKENHKDLWLRQKALYEAVAISSLRHAYGGMDGFPYKTKSFDYTLGQDVAELAKVCDSSTLLFVNGFDYEATFGRVMMEIWKMTLAAAVGVSVIYQHPSFLNLGLVDGNSGELIWFSVNPPQAEYNFRNEKNMDGLIEWETRNFQIKNKK